MMFEEMRLPTQAFGSGQASHEPEAISARFFGLTEPVRRAFKAASGSATGWTPWSRNLVSILLLRRICRTRNRVRQGNVLYTV